MDEIEAMIAKLEQDRALHIKDARETISEYFWAQAMAVDRKIIALKKAAAIVREARSQR